MTRLLDPATATRLEKTAVDNGFDQVQPREGIWLAFSSTKAPLRLWLTAFEENVLVAAMSMAHVAAALDVPAAPVDVPLPTGASSARSVASIADLHHLVRRSFQLSKALPDELLKTFEQATAALPRETEIERLVVERVGQNLFRAGLLDYWQGRCAVTGLAIPELLRASHIKPWAACEADAERLDIFNGLLLAPSLDAAFDRGFITVADDGDVLISGQLDSTSRRALGLEAPLRVAGLTSGHQAYLAFHRANVFKDKNAPRGTHTFERYIGIDYSGAETPTSGLTGIRVYVATPDAPPREERASKGHWSRRGLAEWLVEQLSDGPRTIVGIDHCFSLPKAYFEEHCLQLDWPAFLDDFHAHWPTDRDDVTVESVREGKVGNGAARYGNNRWRRLTEVRAGAAKSAFLFDVPGSVAKSTHSGLPWLQYIRNQLKGRVHIWPFEGWHIASNRSVIVEVYPTLCRARFPIAGVTADQQDAYAVAAWLREIDVTGRLQAFLKAPTSDDDRIIASAEGWILGV